MQPTVGRIVHYQGYGTPGGEYKPEPRAAIITSVDPDDHEFGPLVSLAVFNRYGLGMRHEVPFSEEPRPGHWNWPPRVEASI
jgi:hypothetical protein